MGNHREVREYLDHAVLDKTVAVKKEGGADGFGDQMIFECTWHYPEGEK